MMIDKMVVNVIVKSSIVIETNRIWFVRLKDYLMNRYAKAKTTEQGISISFLPVFLLDLPEAPSIEVTALSEYSAMITILNEEINQSTESELLYVVRYRSLPHVSLSFLPFIHRLFFYQILFFMF